MNLGNPQHCAPMSDPHSLMPPHCEMCWVSADPCLIQRNRSAQVKARRYWKVQDSGISQHPMPPCWDLHQPVPLHETQVSVETSVDPRVEAHGTGNPWVLCCPTPPCQDPHHPMVMQRLKSAQVSVWRHEVLEIPWVRHGLQ